MSSPAISVENLSKLYRIGQRQTGYRTIRETLTNFVASPMRRLVSRNGHPNTVDQIRNAPTIWALNDVSFQVRPGEVIGIIGRNGAGKSTLLKILSRITEPTSGRAEIRGRIASLLEVGTGFHPELTGRENIFLNGSILGMRRREITDKFDEIVAFAEIEKFLDTPVKRYSSGMYVRLAFAVAAYLEPEILLVDEVLAVGDAQFRKKCLGKMSDVASQGRTVLFVSHNMGAITRLCERTLFLDNGHVSADGPSEEIISHYLSSGAVTTGEQVWNNGISNSGVTEFKILAVRIRNEEGTITGTFDVRKPFSIEIEYEVLKRLPHCRVGFWITTTDGITVLTTYDSDRQEYEGIRQEGRFSTKCTVPGNLLSPNRFAISVNAGMVGYKNLAFLDNILLFDIEDLATVGAHLNSARAGVIRPSLRWDREPLHVKGSQIPHDR